MDKQPYYVAHQPGDRAFGYMFRDPTRELAPLLVVRPLSEPVDNGFEATYSQALKDQARAPERVAGFRFPEPVYRTRDELAAGEPDLGSHLGATSLAKLLVHVGVAEDVHGRLHERYDGWAEAKPFDRVKGETRFWRRTNGRLMPDMSQVSLPAYDASGTTLTFFTMRRIDQQERRYDDPWISHYEAWRHVVHLDAKPWRFDTPTRVSEVDVRAKERVVVDAAFGGPVELFAEASLGGGKRLLLNLDAPGRTRRFVVVDLKQTAIGSYDTLEAMLAAHPEVDRAEFVRRLVRTVNDFSYTRAGVIGDAQAWRDTFGRVRRERIGPPKFTLDQDLSEYRTLPAVPAPPFADQVSDPRLDGHDLVVFARSQGQIAEYRWDTRKLTEGECFTRTALGEEPSAGPSRNRPIP